MQPVPRCSPTRYARLRLGGSNGGHRKRRPTAAPVQTDVSARLASPRRPPRARRGSATRSTPQPRRVCSPATSARAGSPAPTPNSPAWITSGFGLSLRPPFGSSSSSSYATRSSLPSIATSDGWQSAIPRSQLVVVRHAASSRARCRRVHDPDRDLERFLDLPGDAGDRPRLPRLQRRARRDRRARADNATREPRLGRAPRLPAARTSRRAGSRSTSTPGSSSIFR